MTFHVLILCTHNSARSVLSEGMLNHWAKRLGRDVKAHSAGSAPSGRINPFAIEALQNAGIEYIYQLVEKTEAEMLKTKNFGRKSLNEIKDTLKDFDLTLGMKLHNFPKHRVG